MRHNSVLCTLPLLVSLIVLTITLACSTDDQETVQLASVETISGDQRDSGEEVSSSQYRGLSELPLSDTQDRGVWVTGSGVFESEPDMVVVRLGVSALAKTVALAQSEAGKYMTNIQEAALNHGVVEKDIQTVDYSIYPEYHYEDVTIGSKRQTKRVLAGYRVTNGIVVKLRAMGKEGAIIDALAKAGGDAIVVDDISFVLDDTSDAQIRARELAVIDATNRAQQIATTMGITIGRPIYVREISATTYEASVPQMYGVARAYMDESSVSTPIMGGVLDMTVKVSVVFAIGG